MWPLERKWVKSLHRKPHDARRRTLDIDWQPSIHDLRCLRVRFDYIFELVRLILTFDLGTGSNNLRVCRIIFINSHNIFKFHPCWTKLSSWENANFWLFCSLVTFTLALVTCCIYSTLRLIMKIPFGEIDASNQCWSDIYIQDHV